MKNNPDREAYEKLWESGIFEEIKKYKNKYPHCIEIIPDAKEEIWSSYVYFNTYVKTNYMKDKVILLDRHKVTACYMAAIATVRPMRFVGKIDGLSVPLAINEQLAITIAFSLLCSYIITKTKQDESLEDDKKKDIISKMNNGIYIPDNSMVWHGSYLDNYANELAYAVRDGKICILSLAHELHLLEVLTRK